MRTFLRGLILITLLILYLTLESLAGCLYTALEILTHPQQDTAVELELSPSPEVMNLLTTPDGKVRSLLLPWDEFPHWFVSKQAELHPDIKDPGTLDWDALDHDTQLRLIDDLSLQRRQVFKEDRIIHGLVTKKSIRMKFEVETEFLGQTYSPGEHVVDLSAGLMDRVEYGDPESIHTLAGIELHFRNRQTSGKTSNQAWDLLDGLNIERNHQHVHTVAPIPIASLKNQGRTYSGLLGDFFRRANLAAEMIEIMEEGGGITTRTFEGFTFFGSMTPEKMKGVTEYFQDLAKGIQPKIGDKFKMGWVGMRGSDKYDAPGLWGLEVRSISETSNPETNRTFLDALQFKMNAQDYGIPVDQMARWLARKPEQSPADQVAQAWYNHPLEELGKKAPKEIQAKINGFFGPNRRRQINENAKEYQELKMLLHDWSNDPLVFENPALQAKIINAQKKAMNRMLWPNSNINSIMKKFLLESGLYQEVLHSLGVKLQASR